MTPPVIITPRGFVAIDRRGKATLEWFPGFKVKWETRYTKSQKFVDSEILRLSEPYTPLRTGMLIKSGILGTEIGSGEVRWVAIYSRWQYYASRTPGSETGPLRGPFWFERMKRTFGPRIIAGAKKMAGGG